MSHYSGFVAGGLMRCWARARRVTQQFYYAVQTVQQKDINQVNIKDTKSIITKYAAIFAAGTSWSELYAQDSGNSGMNDHWGNMMYGGWGMSGMWIGGVILLAVVIFLIARVSGSARHSRGGETPMEILKMRYANGEISDEQFRKMKQQLQ